MPLTRDNFRLSRLVVIGQVFQITPLHQTLLPGEVPQLQQTLSPQVIARIYGELAAIGYASLRQVPGGAQMSSADGSMTLQVTGTGFQFSENLRVTGIVPAIERLERAIESFFNSLSPDTSVAGQTVDLQGVWDNLGQQADEYMNRRFLTAEAPRLVDYLRITFNGGAVHLSLVRAAVASLPDWVV